MKNILAIGAHFDDVDLAAGGTLNYLASNKTRNIYKLTLTDNVTLSKNLKLNISFETSYRSSEKACKILGITQIKNEKIVDCTKLFYNSNLMQYIENIIFEKKIDTVFIHFDHDLNQDHISSSEICKTASRHCKNILMYQSNFYLSSKQFNPTVFFDISKNFLIKKKALDSYNSEHNRKNSLFELTFKRNQVWGGYAGVEYAEAFVPVKFLHE